MLSRSGQIDLLITVNVLSQCDNVCWLQWIFADEEYKAFTDYSERLALCENVARVCWLQWTSHQHGTIVALSPVFTSTHHLLITVNLQPSLADYSEPFTDCSERWSSTNFCWLITVNVQAISAATTLLLSLHKAYRVEISYWLQWIFLPINNKSAVQYWTKKQYG